METIESRHKLAKQRIKDITEVLLNEGRINVETAKTILGLLKHIEDDALALFSYFAPRHIIEFEQGMGDSKKKYVAEITIKEL